MAPGMNAVSDAQLRPFSGSSSACVLSIKPVMATVLVSISSELAKTFTVSSPTDTRKVASRVRVLPITCSTSVNVRVLKPGWSNVML